MNEPLSDEKLHELYRLENGLRQIHEATTRINSMLSDFDPALRHLPEFFLGTVALDLAERRRAHELALDQQRGSAMLEAERIHDGMQGPFITRHEKVAA